MRQLFFIICGASLLAGCSSATSPKTTDSARVGATGSALTGDFANHSAPPATALAFDPAIKGPALVLSRDNRGISAFGGFQDLTVESYDIQTDDDQLFYNYPATYERRVISDKVGTTYH